jgi:hypothetical protein
MFNFDYGRNRYDLIVFMYMRPFTDSLAEQMTAALKPGGLVVMEHFSGGLAPDLPKRLESSRAPRLVPAHTFPALLHHAEEDGNPDYDQHKEGRVVRFLARKP